MTFSAQLSLSWSSNALGCRGSAAAVCDTGLARRHEQERVRTPRKFLAFICGQLRADPRVPEILPGLTPHWKCPLHRAKTTSDVHSSGRAKPHAAEAPCSARQPDVVSPKKISPAIRCGHLVGAVDRNSRCLQSRLRRPPRVVSSAALSLPKSHSEPAYPRWSSHAATSVAP
jgi:hypothetical protein